MSYASATNYSGVRITNENNNDERENRRRADRKCHNATNIIEYRIQNHLSKVTVISAFIRSQVSSTSSANHDGTNESLTAVCHDDVVADQSHSYHDPID